MQELLTSIPILSYNIKRKDEISIYLKMMFVFCLQYEDFFHCQGTLQVTIVYVYLISNKKI